MPTSSTSPRKLTGAFFQSLDGVMQAPGGPEEDVRGGFRFGGWTAPFWDASMEEPMGKLFAGPPFDLLLGKRTYEIFASYWPDNLDNPIGATFQRIAKYVLTHDAAPLEWANSHRLSGDTAASVAALKATPGPDLLIQGSSSLYQPLLAAGLIDRLLVMTFPVVLGQGIRVFDGGASPAAFKMTERFVSGTGVTMMTYEPMGAVPTGTFETKPPSAAELQRRAAWARL